MGITNSSSFTSPLTAAAAAATSIVEASMCKRPALPVTPSTDSGFPTKTAE